MKFAAQQALQAAAAAVDGQGGGEGEGGKGGQPSKKRRSGSKSAQGGAQPEAEVPRVCLYFRSV